MCPVPNCKSYFDPYFGYQLYSSGQKIRYKDILEKVVRANYRALNARCIGLLSTLTLTCPHCNTAVDPSPDACSAVQCLTCSGYYCHCCFAGFKSADTNKDRGDAHIHAATHKPVKPGETADAFVPSDVVLCCQQELRMKLLIEYCLTASTNSEEMELIDGVDYENLSITSAALILCEQDLLQIGIQPEKLWTALWEKVHHDDVSTLSPAPSVEIEVVKEVNLAEVLRKAIISLNTEAMRQVITTNGFEKYIIEPIKDTHNQDSLLTLSLACHQEWLAIELIKKGASVLAKNHQGYCSLHIAAEKGYLHYLEEVATVYPELDWNMVVTDTVGHFAVLHTAVWYKQSHLISFLLQHGASIEKEEDEYGYTALDLACIAQDYYSVIQLITCSNPEITNPFRITSRQGRSAMYFAIENGSIMIVRALITSYPHLINQPVDILGRRMIHIAATHHSPMLLQSILVIVRSLLPTPLYHNHINVLDDEGWSALRSCVFKGHQDQIRILIDAGCRIREDQNGRTTYNNALFMCIERGYVEVVKEIVSRSPVEELLRPCGLINGVQVIPLFVAAYFHQWDTVDAVAFDRTTSEKTFLPIENFVQRVMYYAVRGFDQLQPTRTVKLSQLVNRALAGLFRNNQFMTEIVLVHPYPLIRYALTHDLIDLYAILMSMLFTPPDSSALKIAKEILQTLLEDTGLSIFHYMCMKDSIQCFTWTLFQVKGDVDGLLESKDRHGRVALQIAADSQANRILQVLRRYSPQETSP